MFELAVAHADVSNGLAKNSVGPVDSNIHFQRALSNRIQQEEGFEPDIFPCCKNHVCPERLK